MPDKFLYSSDSVAAPARKLVAVTPNDGADLADVPKALYIGAAGTLALIAADDTASVSLTVAAGAVLPIRAKRVLATGTTATDIVALY